MKLRSFVLGMVALVSLSSCNSQATSSVPAAATSQPHAVSRPLESSSSVVQAEVAPDEEKLLTLEEANAAAENYDYDAEDSVEMSESSSNLQASSDDGSATIEKVQTLSREVMKVAQGNMKLTSGTYQMAQQVGDQATMQSCQELMELHERAYGEFAEAANNPGAYLDRSSSEQLLSRAYEYLYRASKGDMRPADQIQGQLAAFRQQTDWEANTPEGKAHAEEKSRAVGRQIAQFGETMTANHKRNMANIATSAKAHQDKMNALHEGARARDAAWAEGQKAGDEVQGQRIGAIYENYEYVNPNTGERHWIPASNTNPTVINDDGSTTELQPYRPSSNY